MRVSEGIDGVTTDKEQAPAFQFYVKEWRSSRAVMRMTFAERGMYLEMLFEQWESYTLPDSPDECSELIGGTLDEWRAAWPTLRRKFVSDVPGRIYNARLEKVRHERRAYEKWAKKNARKGGLARAASAKRGKDGTYSPAQSQPGVQPENQLDVQPTNQRPPASASASATPTATASALSRVPLVAKRRLHAAWEGEKGLYVPLVKHQDFVALRNHPGADDELHAWYEQVAASWQGSPGADMIKFWTARFEERWPAQVPVATKRPWAPLRVS